jgi:UDP-N-acetylmuramoyl-L-alanyl-D-glutamate--2,6-diaminopimelate ligase
MKLKTLLKDVPVREVFNPNDSLECTSLTCDSNKVQPGSLFVAIRGANSDGHSFIREAVSRGALAVLIDSPLSEKPQCPIYAVENSRDAYAKLAAQFFNHPSQKVKTIGVTGTNGKTTTTFLLTHILRARTQVGMLSTILYDNGRDISEAFNTTPDPYTVQESLRTMCTHGCRYCVMEVSSHALAQNRVTALHFDAAIFTNLTQDHLDYHKTMESYFLEKLKLFTTINPHLTIVNVDDPYGKRIVAQVHAEKCFSYAIDAPADFKASNIVLGLSCSTFDVTFKGETYHLESPLIGKHNVYNVLAAFAYAMLDGLSAQVILDQLRSFAGVKGRLERFSSDADGRIVFVDYAHTPDAFVNIFRSVKALVPGRIITVFGCGGDRDKGKRPLMGARAAEYSDSIIVTTDNPRSESEESIVDDILRGIPSDVLSRTQVILDRKKAIELALSLARRGDIVLVLGKGHEEYMLKNGVKTYFSDQDIVSDCLRGVKNVHA